MLVRAHGFAIQRGLAGHVIVELDVRGGLPAFSVIGLAAASARDARERVQAAILNSGLPFPRRRVTVNLAPASSRRSGSEFDLAIACCVIAAEGPIDPHRLARIGLFGELGLGGLLRPCPGVAAAAAAAGDVGLQRLIVALGNLGEARAVDAVPVTGVRDLAEVVDLLSDPEPQPDERPPRRDPPRAAAPGGRWPPPSGRGAASRASAPGGGERAKSSGRTGRGGYRDGGAPGRRDGPGCDEPAPAGGETRGRGARSTPLTRREVVEDIAPFEIIARCGYCG